LLCIDKLYSLCPSILKLPSDDKSSPSDLLDVAAVTAAAPPEPPISSYCIIIVDSVNELLY
jgi:hypothetical protein